MREINEMMLRLSKRAEQYDPEHLVASFVDAGALLTILKNRDNQVIFGRRGTGKTHVLSYLAQQLRNQRDLVVVVDMRTIGSSGGIYADPTRPLPERATRLLIDTLQAIHARLVEAVLADDQVDLKAVQRPLDDFANSTVDVYVDGTISTEVGVESSAKSKDGFNFGVGSVPSFTSEMCGEQSSGLKTKETRSGSEKLRVIFGRVGQDLTEFTATIGKKRLWILLDEWSEVPLDLQPYLADLLRRTVFPVSGVSVKLAAIEQRTNFRVHDAPSGSYVGIEIGADVAASLNLDEFMVFDNDPAKAGAFFKQLLFKHATALRSDQAGTWPANADRFISDLFTQSTAFDEFVRASEGVPRDAINIIGLAAQSSGEDKVSVAAVRESARIWYHRSKEGAVQGRSDALTLLRWIIEVVIKNKQAKAFLLQSGTRDSLIDYLYDSRILHVIKQGISAQDQPGVRFNVYSIDYGCYVDLLTTKHAPKGLFQAVDTDKETDGHAGDGAYVDVPSNDYRSIRRSILRLSEFYGVEKSEVGVVKLL